MKQQIVINPKCPMKSQDMAYIVGKVCLILTLDYEIQSETSMQNLTKQNSEALQLNLSKFRMLDQCIFPSLH